MRININLSLVILLVLMQVPRYSQAQQNLVPNPSFEDTTHCPATGGLDGLANWFNCGGSPDYYNGCASISNPVNSAPLNWLGFQIPYNGVSYAGLVTYVDAASPQREYMGVQLAQPLTQGTKYFVTTRIVRADSGDVPPYTCASNNFGFKFSTVAYDYTSPAPTDNSSQIHSSSIVSDTIGWTKISGSFIADSAYEFLVLGNFYSNQNTDTSDCGYSSMAYAYYFIDEVCVSVDSLTCEIAQSFQPVPPIQDIRIYPNPAIEFISIDNIPIGDTITCTFFDLAGRKILEQLISEHNNIIQVGSLAAGIYILKIDSFSTKITILD